MWHDVIDLRDFYQTRLGMVARMLIRRQIRALWPDVRGESVLGLGYATPYLRLFRGEAARLIAMMPAAQGVMHWPPEGPNVAALVEPGHLPLDDCSIDRLLVVHAVEHSERTEQLLREAWRVLAGNGRLLVVLPNRRSLWARLDRTPFGWGHPYSARQLSRLLRASLFTPLRTESALYLPPLRSSTLLRAAPAADRIGTRWFPTFGGVLIVEARKQLYAPSATVERQRVRRPRLVVVPETARASRHVTERSDCRS